MRVLSDTDIEDIRIRFATGTITKAELGREYNCHKTTIALWLAPESVRKVKLAYHKPVKRCDCGKPYKDHPRCQYCEILTHGEACDCRVPKLYFTEKVTMFHEITGY